MRPRKLLVVVFTLGLFLLGAGPAQAWDFIHGRDGFGRVTVRAWTRSYNQVAYVVDHAGSRVDVEVSVTCRSGYTYDNSWVDGGERFRFVLRGLGDEGRCDHVFKTTARRSGTYLDAAIYARG